MYALTRTWERAMQPLYDAYLDVHVDAHAASTKSSTNFARFFGGLPTGNSVYGRK
jgi:hypothetical protein